MINTLIFDFDDTICNTTECIEEALAHCYLKLVKYYPRITHKDFVKADHEAFKELFYHDRIPVYRASIRIWFRIFKKLKLKQDVVIIYRMYKYLHQTVAKNIRLNDGLKELWDYALENKLKIGILSNGAFLEKIERLIKLDLYTPKVKVVTSDLTGYDKPDPKAFRKMLRILNSKPSQSVFIGDTPSTDIFGAKRVRILPILFKQKDKQYKSTDFKHCKYIVKSHREIIDILEKINGNEDQ